MCRVGAAAPDPKGQVDWDGVCLLGNQYGLVTHNLCMLGSQGKDWGMGDPRKTLVLGEDLFG